MEPLFAGLLYLSTITASWSTGLATRAPVVESTFVVGAEDKADCKTARQNVQAYGEPAMRLLGGLRRGTVEVGGCVPYLALPAAEFEQLLDDLVAEGVAAELARRGVK